ncbi:unnamed protein product [Amoebophrya sp. A25]|nr:unnamed protein product [Amoebophrya sp. A25]|eukprot:GSA25T00007547001.1
MSGRHHTSGDASSGDALTLAAIEAALAPGLHPDTSAALLASVEVAVAHASKPVVMHVSSVDIDCNLRLVSSSGSSSGAVSSKQVAGSSCSVLVTKPDGVLEKDWKRRHYFWSRFDRGIRMDVAGFFEVTPESISAYISYRFRHLRSIVDGTVGCGGNLVQFLRPNSDIIDEIGRCVLPGWPSTTGGGVSRNAKNRNHHSWNQLGRQTGRHRLLVGVDIEDIRLEDCTHNLRIYGHTGRIERPEDCNSKSGRVDKVQKESPRARLTSAVPNLDCTAEIEAHTDVSPLKPNGNTTAVVSEEMHLRRGRFEKVASSLVDISHVSLDASEILCEQERERKFDVVFLSPPWGGPEHLDLDVFRFSFVTDVAGIPCDIRELFAAACGIARNVVLYLPRHQDLRELAQLAADFGFPEFEVESVCYVKPHRHRKLLIAYFGRDLLLQEQARMYDKMAVKSANSIGNGNNSPMADHGGVGRLDSTEDELQGVADKSSKQAVSARPEKCDDIVVVAEVNDRNCNKAPSSGPDSNLGSSSACSSAGSRESRSTTPQRPSSQRAEAEEVATEQRGQRRREVLTTRFDYCPEGVSKVRILSRGFISRGMIPKMTRLLEQRGVPLLSL